VTHPESSTTLARAAFAGPADIVGDIQGELEALEQLLAVLERDDLRLVHACCSDDRIAEVRAAWWESYGSRATDPFGGRTMLS